MKIIIPKKLGKLTKKAEVTKRYLRKIYNKRIDQITKSNSNYKDNYTAIRKTNQE